MKRALYLMIVVILCCITATGVFADPPANDECINAYNLGTLVSEIPAQYSGTVTDATVDCSMYFSQGEVWVKFTLDNAMNITIDFCDNASLVMETSRYLFAECPCNDEYNVSVTDFCTSSFNPYFTWHNVPAGTYYYAISSRFLMEESYTITITGENVVVPDNDNCADAITVGEVTDQAFTTIGASFDGEGTCTSSSAPNVWYIYTPTFTGNARVIIDSDFRESAAVYNGGDCSTLPAQLDCAEDGRLDFEVVAGQNYLIEIGGRYSREFGEGTFTISEVPEGPANDNCEDATDAGTLSSGYTVRLNGTVTEASIDCLSIGIPEVWIKFTLTTSMNVTIDFCDDWGTVMGSFEKLFRECPCADEINYDESAFCVNNNPSKTWYTLTAGTYYYPILAISHQTGSYTINITGEEVVAPSNDDCANATSINEVDELEYTTQGASFDGEGTCTSAPNVWYIYTPTFTGEARITVDATYPEKVAVYNGADCSPLSTELACFDNGQAFFDAVSGEQYLIEIGSSNSGTTGRGLLTIEESPERPANDECANADDAGTLSLGETVTLTGTVVEATNDCGLYSKEEVWIKFTITDCMNVAIDFCDDDGDVDFGSNYLYTVCPCDNEGRIYVSYTEYCENHNPSLSWYELSAGTYYYPIFTEDIAEGSYSINITGVACLTDPEPDFSVTAPYSGTNTTCGAGNDCYQVNSGEDHIYEVTIPSAGTWSFSLCNSISDTWHSFILLGSSICDYDLGSDSYSCENGHAELTVDELAVGTYYLLITNSDDTCGEYTLDITKLNGGTYEYMPGDANMINGQWPPLVIGSDVTYLVGYFRGINGPCLISGFFNSADANGDCLVIGSDVTKMVTYFRGLTTLSHCADYPPAWPTPADLPSEEPAGWPNCETAR